MTKERIKKNLDYVEAIMDLYEAWFLTGDAECLAKMHDLVVKPLLIEADKLDGELGDSAETDLSLRLADEKLRSLVSCRLLEEREVASAMLAIVAADCDPHVTSMVLVNRQIKSACQMADSILSLGDELEGFDESESFGRLVRIFHERLSFLKDKAEGVKSGLDKEREAIEKLKGYEIDERAVEMLLELIDLCAEILSDLEAWLEVYPELDPGTDFLDEYEKDDEPSAEDGKSEDGDKGDEPEGEGDDDHDDEGKGALHGIGIAIMNGEEFFKMLFGDDYEEE